MVGSFYGFEVSATMLAQARRQFRGSVTAGSLQLAEAPMNRLPVPDASLDALVSCNTVYFIEDLSAAFTELARTLRPGGRAVLALGDPDRMARLPFTRYGFRLRPVADVAGFLRDAGLEVTGQRAGDGPGASHLLVARKPG